MTRHDQPMGYWEHLVANWRVAFRSLDELSLHALGDFLEHFLHGLIPFIHWEHQQPGGE